MKRILPIAGLTLAFAAPAHAASYQVYGCDGPDGRARALAPFRDFEVPADSLNHDDYCQTVADVAYFDWAPGVVVAGGRRGGWRLDAPDGTTVTELGWRGSASGISGRGVRVELATGDDGATFWDSGTDFDPDLRQFVLPAGARTLILRQACRLVACAIGPGPARTTTLALTATLDDASPPVASGFTGTLAAPGARHGAVGLSFAAADAGSGLRRATLDVDGRAQTLTIDPSQACAPLPGSARGYDTTSPCARSAAVELPWSTAGVQDGPHTVSARLEDAAGNVRTVFGPVTVTTDNAPPAAGTVTVSRAGATLAATPSGFDGQDIAYAYRWQRCDPDCDDIDGATHTRYTPTAADAGERVRAVVTATDLGGATTARSAPVTIDPAASAQPVAAPAPAASPAQPVAAPAPAASAPAPAATRACAATARLALARPPAAAPGLAALPARALLAAPARAARSAPGLAGLSTCPHVTLSRRTISLRYGQRAEISGRVAGPDDVPVAGATLDVSARVRVPGAVATRVGGVGSARDGRFTYVAPAGPSRDVTIGGRTVSLLVTASGTFKATRSGARVRFSGRLRGGHVPRGGVLVEIRGKRGLVALARTDARGVYRATTTATRQSFRARTRKDSSWPFVGAPVGSPVSA